jgi:hypothetical protein
MNWIARSCWVSAPLYALVGMGFGIWMSATGQHLYSPAHAHLNLLGFVSMALFGAYYTLVPAAAASMLARIQVLSMHAGAILMFPGVIMAIDGKGDGLAKAGSLLAIISMLLFAFIAMRTRETARA